MCSLCFTWSIGLGSAKGFYFSWPA